MPSYARGSHRRASPAKTRAQHGGNFGRQRRPWKGSRWGSKNAREEIAGVTAFLLAAAAQEGRHATVCAHVFVLCVYACVCMCELVRTCVRVCTNLQFQFQFNLLSTNKTICFTNLNVCNLCVHTHAGVCGQGQLALSQRCPAPEAGQKLNPTPHHIRPEPLAGLLFPCMHSVCVLTCVSTGQASDGAGGARGALYGGAAQQSARCTGQATDSLVLRCLQSLSRKEPFEILSHRYAELTHFRTVTQISH